MKQSELQVVYSIQTNQGHLAESYQTMSDAKDGLTNSTLRCGVAILWVNYIWTQKMKQHM